MSSHANRTPRGHLNSVYARLGSAAVIGGLERVMREITSDRFADTLQAAKDADARRRILQTAQNIVEKARTQPRAPRAPNPNERVKVRWTDDLVARFKREARWCKNNEELARRLGLPSYCAGSMSAARSRYLGKASATAKRPQIESGLAELSLAA
jgi:uncharacterized protein (DUF4415 family)